MRRLNTYSANNESILKRPRLHDGFRIFRKPGIFLTRIGPPSTRNIESAHLSLSYIIPEIFFFLEFYSSKRILENLGNFRGKIDKFENFRAIWLFTRHFVNISRQNVDETTGYFGIQLGQKPGPVLKEQLQIQNSGQHPSVFTVCWSLFPVLLLALKSKFRLLPQQEDILEVS